MTNYSRSVLKSNGLRHSKNLPVKFGFSPRTVPANIAKKLPPQRCFKPLFIPVFNFPHKRPTFAFTVESGYTLAFANRIPHNGSHAETGGVSNGGAISTLGAFCAVRKPCAARCQNGKLCRFWGLGRGCSQRTQRAFGTAIRMMRVAVPRRRGPAGLRDLFLLLSKLWLVRPALRAFCVCEAWVVSLPSVCFASCRNAGRPLVKAANLPFSCVPYLHL